MLKPVILIVVGFAAGWLAHALLEVPETPDSTSMHPEMAADTSMSGSAAGKPEPETEVAEVSPAVPAQVEQVTDPDTPAPDQVSAMLLTLKVRDFSSAVNECLRAPLPLMEPCRQAMLGAVDAGELTPYEASQLLEIWLLEFPEDIDAGVRLVEILINDEQYVAAARRLALLQSYQVEPGRLERVAAEIQAVARAAIIKLTITDDRQGLESLLGILIEMEPHRATWHYSLAKVQYEMENYSEALNTLSYILFDPDYGDRASMMYETITEKLNLASYSPVPITISGSHFLVRATIDSIHDVTLLLDTGASITSLDSSLVQKLGLKSSSSRQLLLRTAGGVISAKTIVVDSLDIGGHKVRNLEVASIDLGTGVADGLLGMNFLDKYRFVIDQKQRRLLLTRK